MSANSSSSNPRILAIAPDDDDHSEFMRQVCQNKGIEFKNIDLSATAATGECAWEHLPGLKTSLCETDLSGWNVWWRRAKNPPANTSLLDQRFRSFASRQWEVFFRSAFHGVSKRIVNDPECERRADLKPNQLDAAQQVGLKTPITLVTNAAGRAEQFITGKREIFPVIALRGRMC